MLRGARIRDVTLVVVGVVTPVGILAVNASAFVMQHLAEFRLFLAVAALVSGVLLNVSHLSIPQLLLCTALMNAVVAIYIYTLVPEFLLRFVDWILINTLYRIRTQGLEHDVWVEYVSDSLAAIRPTAI